MRWLTIMPGLCLIAGCSGGMSTAPAPEKPGQSITAIRSNSIALPDDNDGFGDNAQGELLTANCMACHSAAMVRYQPPLNRAQWTATVVKMREAYHAPIDPADTDAIVDALMTLAPSRP